MLAYRTYGHAPFGSVKTLSPTREKYGVPGPSMHELLQRFF